MTLDEYRGTLIERLRACGDTAAARSLLADASLFLTNSRINRRTQDRFWETLEEELDALAKTPSFLRIQEPQPPERASCGIARATRAPHPRPAA